MTTEQTALERAIQYLGAVEVAPGRYAIKDGIGGSWYIHNSHDTRLLALDLEGNYTGKAIKMPDWWTPEQQFALFDRSYAPAKFLGSYKTPQDAKKDYYCSIGRTGEGPYIYPVTVNLETGEEIPA